MALIRAVALAGMLYAIYRSVGKEAGLKGLVRVLREGLS
jgi:hypothetical protein